MTVPGPVALADILAVGGGGGKDVAAGGHDGEIGVEGDMLKVGEEGGKRANGAANSAKEAGGTAQQS